MKLYYSPGACSQAAHILLHETGLPHDGEAVDIRAKKTAGGGDYWAINPKGAVPALELADGEVLTENGAILQYIGDKSGNGSLLPVAGLERYRVIEWLSFLGSELHKSFGPLFNPSSSDEARLEGRDYLAGPLMSIADPYLFAMLGWTGKLGIDLARWPNLAALRQRMEQRPAVQAVLKAEGLA
jgi:glutathione S-transferase